jgi:hypothetical protein
MDSNNVASVTSISTVIVPPRAAGSRLRHDGDAGHRASGSEGESVRGDLPTKVRLPPVGITQKEAVELRLDALLDDPVPADWHDPTARARRLDILNTVALKAGDAMVELLARLPDERRLGVHMDEGRCVLTCVDATFALHRALVAYQRGTLRFDGLDVAYQSIIQTHGAGVAQLVRRSLDELRQRLVAEMQSLHGRMIST